MLYTDSRFSSSFFNEVYLYTAGTRAEVGTDKLYKNPLLWKAIKLLVTEELATYHTQQYPVLTEDQELFAYEGILLLIKKVLQEHYNKTEYLESARIVTEIVDPIVAFAERVVTDISDIHHIKCLCSLIVELKKHVPVPAQVINHLASRLSVKESGIADSPAKAR